MSTGPQELTPDVLRALQQHLLAQGAVLPDGVNLQQALAFAQQAAAAAAALGEAGSDGGDSDSENEDGVARKSSDRVSRGKQGLGKGSKPGDKASGRAGATRLKGKDADDEEADDRTKGGKPGKGGAGASKDVQPPRKKAKAEAVSGPESQFDPLRNLDVLAAAALAQAHVEKPAALGAAPGTSASAAAAGASPKPRVAAAAGPATTGATVTAAHAMGPVRGLPPLATAAAAPLAAATGVPAAQGPSGASSGAVAAPAARPTRAVSGGSGGAATVAAAAPAMGGAAAALGTGGGSGSSGGGAAPAAVSGADSPRSGAQPAASSFQSSAPVPAAVVMPIPTRPRTRRPLPPHIATQRQASLPGGLRGAPAVASFLEGQQDGGAVSMPSPGEGGMDDGDAVAAAADPGALEAAAANGGGPVDSGGGELLADDEQLPPPPHTLTTLPLTQLPPHPQQQPQQQPLDPHSLLSQHTPSQGVLATSTAPAAVAAPTQPGQQQQQPPQMTPGSLPNQAAVDASGSGGAMDAPMAIPPAPAGCSDPGADLAAALMSSLVAPGLDGTQQQQQQQQQAATQQQQLALLPPPLEAPQVVPAAGTATGGGASDSLAGGMQALSLPALPPATAPAAPGDGTAQAPVTATPLLLPPATAGGAGAAAGLGSSSAAGPLALLEQQLGAQLGAEPMMVASLIQAALASHEAAMAAPAANAATQLGELLAAATAAGGGGNSLAAAMAAAAAAAEGLMAPGALGGGGAGSHLHQLTGGLMGGLPGDGGDDAAEFAAAVAAATAGRKRTPRRRGGNGVESDEMLDEDMSDDEGKRREARDRRVASQARRFYEPAVKVGARVTFDEGMKLADGRIYVPLPFVHKNFADQQFPLRLPADVVVNGEVIHENFMVKIARSQNKTRRHGLGNHWVTGHQRLIKNYKDVRLTGLELVEDSKLRILLSASGTWDDPNAPHQQQQQPHPQQPHPQQPHPLALGPPGALAGLQHAGLLGLPPGPGGFGQSGLLMKAEGSNPAGGFDLGALLAMQAAAAAAAGHPPMMSATLPGMPPLLPGGSNVPAGTPPGAPGAALMPPLPGGLTHHMHQGFPPQGPSPNTFLAMLGGGLGSAPHAGSAAASGAAAGGVAGAMAVPPLLLPAPLPQGADSAAGVAADGIVSQQHMGGEAQGHPGSGSEGQQGQGQQPGAGMDAAAAPHQQPPTQGPTADAGGFAGLEAGGLAAALAGLSDGAHAADAGRPAAEGGATEGAAADGTEGRPSDAAAQQQQQPSQQPSHQQQQQQAAAAAAAAAALSWPGLSMAPGSLPPMLLPHAAGSLYPHPHHPMLQHPLPQHPQAPGQQQPQQPGEGSAAGQPQPALEAGATGVGSLDSALAAMHSLMMAPGMPPPGSQQLQAAQQQQQASGAAAGMAGQFAAAAAAAAAAAGGHMGAPGAPPGGLPGLSAAIAGGSGGAQQPGSAAAGGGGLNGSQFQLAPSFFLPLMQPPGTAGGGAAAAGAGGQQDSQAAAAGHMGSLSALAGLPAGLMGPGGFASTSDLLAAAAANGQWSMDAIQTLLSGGQGLLGLPRPGVGQPAHAVGNSLAGGNQQFPRLYDGRIHVPLNLINTHFANVEFPVTVHTKVIINSDVVGESIQARIVKYKKHRRPNHFNYWITGLQKTLSRYNDVRQAGVSLEPGSNIIRVNLVAAGS